MILENAGLVLLMLNVGFLAPFEELLFRDAELLVGLLYFQEWLRTDDVEVSFGCGAEGN